LREIHEDQNNRQRIMEEAVDLFAHKGYEAVSVREIAEAAEVTKPVIYYYFQNKRDLYLNLIGDAFQQSHRIYNDIFKADTSADEKLRALMLAHFQFCIDYPNTVKVLFDTMAGQRNPADITMFRKEFSKNFEILDDIFRLGQETGIFSTKMDRDKMTLMFFGSMRIFVIHHFIEEQSYLSDDLADEVVDAILFGISQQTYSKSIKE